MDELDDMGEHADAAPATPAATLVVFRHDSAGGPAQILMVERSGSLVFAGGATVFPGGKVDPADLELAAAFMARTGLSLDPADAAGRITAVRETLEETGLAVGLAGAIDAGRAAAARRLLLDTGRLADVLEAFDWELDFEALVPFARWWPRHRNMRVFDTRFYLADLGTGAVEVTADTTENRHLFWASAAEALRLADEKAIKIIFPTRRNLERLAQFSHFAAARDHALATPIVTVTPRIELRDGERWLLIPPDAGYPVDGEPLAQADRA
ncbi:NUDIX hydrolase [Novosphingobium sp.]|uniref:NUDIX hydrolase n=1 Tax=Novosphingobium sp. TaxID=1874826 RepID=UPI003BA9C335